MLQPGTKLTIYEDLFARQNPEGQVTIVKHIERVEPGVERYMVHFVGDAPDVLVERIVVEYEFFYPTGPGGMFASAARQNVLCSCTDPLRPDNPDCLIHGGLKLCLPS